MCITSCAQGGTVLTTSETRKGPISIRELCIHTHTCGQSENIETLVRLVACSLCTPDEVLFRFFAYVGDVAEHERRLTRTHYWKVIGAFSNETLVGVCYLGVGRVRARVVGPHMVPGDTDTVELAYVVAPAYRNLGLVSALTDAARELCIRSCVGTRLKIEALGCNTPMVRAMRRMGHVRREDEVVWLIIPIRDKTIIEVGHDVAATACSLVYWAWQYPAHWVGHTVERQRKNVLARAA